MFGLKKENKNIKYFWPSETNFIHSIIALLQRVVDESEYDIRLVYKQTFSFPSKYWKIVLECPEDRIPTSMADINAIEIELVQQFKNSNAFIEASRNLYWLTPCASNSCTTVEISYAVSSYCELLRKPGIIIYWKRGIGN